MSLPSETHSSDSISSSLIEETATEIVQHHENNSIEDMNLCYLNFCLQINSKTLQEITEKNSTNVLMEVESESENIDKMKSALILMQDATNQLINKILEISPSASSDIIENILCGVVAYTKGYIKFCGKQGLLDEVSNCIKEFCQRNYKTLKISAPFLIIDCFNSFNEKEHAFSTFVIEKILLNSEAILSDPNFADVYQLEIPKDLKDTTIIKVTHPSIKNCESANDILLFDGISRDARAAVENVRTLYANNFINDISVFIINFCTEHSQKNLRIGIAEMIRCVNKTIPSADASVNEAKQIIELILFGFNEFITNSGNVNVIKQKIFDERVPQYLFEEIVPVILQHVPTNCLTAVDLLLHISTPDSLLKQHKLILEKINVLDESKKIIWEDTLKKIKDTASNLHPILQKPKDNKSSKNKKKEIMVKDSATNLLYFALKYQDVEKKHIRLAYMKHICELEKLHRLLEMFAFYENYKDDKEVIFGIVSDEDFFKALINCLELFQFLSIPDWKKCSSPIDLLFHISEPETRDRKFMVREILRTMFNNVKTFQIALAFIKSLNLGNFLIKELDKILDSVEEFKMENFFLSLFKDSKDNKHFKLVFSQSERYFNIKRKESLLNEIFNQINDEKTPSNECFTLNAELALEFASNKLDAFEFINILKDIAITENDGIKPGYIKEVLLHGKTYECLYVDSKNSFLYFLIYYLMPYSGDTALDCETGKDGRVTLLQLAGYNWMCIIDVQILLNQISREQWITFFSYLYSKKFKLIGFSYNNDLDYLCKTFPYLQELFQTTNVCCVQKVVERIIRELQTKENKIFDDSLKPGSGLAAHAIHIINIDVNKDQQQSNWEQRPLTEEQVNYAFYDPLIPLLMLQKLRITMNMLMDAHDKEKNASDDEINESDDDFFVSSDEDISYTD